MDLRNLVTFVPRNATIDQLVCVYAQLQTFIAACTALEVELPVWVTEKTEAIEAEVKNITRAAKQADLKKLQMRRAQLATPDEKRTALDKEIAALEAKLK